MWKRKFTDDANELAHKWENEKTLCGLEKEKKTYLQIEINKFPAHKVCPKCLERSK